METLITFFASFLIWFMFGGLFVLWTVDGKIKKEQVVHALLAFIVAWVLTDIIKNIFIFNFIKGSIAKKLISF